jgi:hypothetical protein
MATSFTEDQKSRIRSYLGWSQLFKQIDPRLESQLVMLPQDSPETADRVLAIDAKLQDIDAKLQDVALNNLDLSRAEDVTFLGREQLRGLYDAGRRLIHQLSIIFEVEIERDYYGTDAEMGGVIALG